MCRCWIVASDCSLRFGAERVALCVINVIADLRRCTRCSSGTSSSSATRARSTRRTSSSTSTRRCVGISLVGSLPWIGCVVDPPPLLPLALVQFLHRLHALARYSCVRGVGSAALLPAHATTEHAYLISSDNGFPLNVALLCSCALDSSRRRATAARASTSLLVTRCRTSPRSGFVCHSLPDPLCATTNQSTLLTLCRRYHRCRLPLCGPASSCPCVRLLSFVCIGRWCWLRVAPCDCVCASTPLRPCHPLTDRLCLC